MANLALVPLATGLSDFEAKVLTARLGADGIIWEIRGVVDSVYPFGSVDVLVPLDELADAHACLGPVPVDDADPDTADNDDGTLPAARSWWVAALVCAAAVTFVMLRMLALG